MRLFWERCLERALLSSGKILPLSSDVGQVCVSVCVSVCVCILFPVYVHMYPLSCVRVCVCGSVCHYAAMWGSETFLCPGPASGHRRPLGQHREMMSPLGTVSSFAGRVSCMCVRMLVTMLMSCSLLHCRLEKRICAKTRGLFFPLLVYLQHVI